MIKKYIYVCVLFVIFIFSPKLLWAEDNRVDVLIGSTFKTLAKAFIVTTDIDELKKRHINKIKNMDEEKFKVRYAKAYAVLKDLPLVTRRRYGIMDNLSKKNAVINIDAMDKNKVYKLIDEIPNTLIASQFRKYLAKKKEKEAGRRQENSSLMEEIHKFFNGVIKK